jgi:acyl-coenzyme A synthetase/AMP-(fatty) acid ligase
VNSPRLGNIYFEDGTAFDSLKLHQSTSYVESQLATVQSDSSMLLPVMLDQSPESYVLLLALANLGWNCALLDSSLPSQTLVKMMQQLGADSVIFASRQARDAALSICSKTTHIQLRNSDKESPSPIAEFLNGSVTIFSSGSTDYPKGVVHKWSKLFDWATSRSDSSGGIDKERWINFYPITWSFGLLNLLQVKTGADLFVLDIKKNWPTQLWQKMLEIQPTNLSLTGQLAKALSGSLDKLSSQKLSQVKKFGVSGSNVNWETINLFKNVFSDDAIFNHNLSATEAIRMLSFSCPMKDIPTSGSVPVGKPLVPELTMLKETESANLFQVCFDVGSDTRYLDSNLNATRFESDADGKIWWNSGDLVWLSDSDKLYYYAGRIDDQVKINDHNVSLNQLSTAVDELGGVQRSCAIAVSLGGRPRLFLYVELSEGATLTRLQISEHVSNRLPRYCWPHFIELLDSIPQTRSGKPDRQALKDLALKGNLE